MKIVVFRIFARSILLIANLREPETLTLSGTYLVRLFGAEGFEAPDSIRADQVFIRDVRLPYWKFPRNPEQ